MSEPPHGDSEPEGPSPGTGAWIAHQKAVQRAIEADTARAAEDRAQKFDEIRSARHNPIGFLVTFLVILLALAVFLWFFVERMQCDSFFMDLGGGIACKPPPCPVQFC